MELLDFEYEMLGIFMSGNPLDDFSNEIDNIKGVVLSYDIERLKEGSRLLIVGIIKDIKSKISKKGNRFAEILIVDKVGNIWLQVFEKHLEQIENAPKNKPICLKCRASLRDGLVSLQIEKIISIDEAKSERVNIEFVEENDTKDSMIVAENEIIEDIIDYILDISCNLTYENLKDIQNLAIENGGSERLVFRVQDRNLSYLLYSNYKINNNFKEKIRSFKIA